MRALWKRAAPVTARPGRHDALLRVTVPPGCLPGTGRQSQRDHRGGASASATSHWPVTGDQPSGHRRLASSFAANFRLGAGTTPDVMQDR